MIDLRCGDCLDILPTINMENVVIVTDSPFNVGYHYATYKDKMEDKKYFELLKNVFSCSDNRFVCIH